MDDKPYTITFPNGTVLDRITLNSTTWVSYVKLPVGIFRGVHDEVVATNGESTSIFRMALVRSIESPVEGEYWFAILEGDPTEIAINKMQSDIEYLAMMIGEEL